MRRDQTISQSEARFARRKHFFLFKHSPNSVNTDEYSVTTTGRILYDFARADMHTMDTAPPSQSMWR